MRWKRCIEDRGMRTPVKDADVNNRLMHGEHRFVQLSYLSAAVAAAAAAVHTWKPAAHSQSGLIHTQRPAVEALHK